MTRCRLAGIVAAVGVTAAGAQPAGDAVDLARVKIPERQAPIDLCPVHLVPSNPELPVWTHLGITYRGCDAGDEATFAGSPERYAEPARRQRWINNFVQAMSVIWCPVTDQINPGGIGEWKRHDLPWEACCQFCEMSLTDEDIDHALQRLKTRAAAAYELTGGRYVEGASSPVAGALRK